MKMKNDIRSHNSITGTNKYIVPPISQISLYLFISILLLIVLNGKRLWDYLNHVILAPQGGLDSIIAQKAHGLHKILNSVSQSIILQLLFWVCVGCIVYIFLWFIKNIAINIYNDIVADKYMHPASYNRTGYWESVIVRKVFFVASVVVLIGYMVAASKFFAELAYVCYNSFLDFQLWQSVLQVVAAVVIGTLLVYILVLIAHTAANAWKFIYKDL